MLGWIVGFSQCPQRRRGGRRKGVWREGSLSRFLAVATTLLRREDTALAEEDDDLESNTNNGWGEDDNNLDFMAVINTMMDLT